MARRRELVKILRRKASSLCKSEPAFGKSPFGIRQKGDLPNGEWSLLAGILNEVC